MNTKEFRLSHRRFAFASGALLVAVVSGVGAAVLHAQNTAAAGSADTTIRSETRVVLVDAVALDRKGTFARDLTQKDFKVWEDGKEQPIVSFSLESAAASPERTNKHYIAMLFDSFTVTPASEQRVRQEAIRFVDGFATPDRYMAVMNYHGTGLELMQNFTADADKVKKSLGALQGSTVGTTTAGTGKVAAAGDTLAHTNLLQTISSAAKSLASIRGRKALIVFSSGFDVTGDITEEMARTIDACNDANVALYTIPVGSGSGASAAATGGQTTTTRAGRGGGGATTATDDASSNENVLRSLADGTGGVWMPPVTNDMAGALGKIAQEQDQYYLIGYTPPTETGTDPCHKIRVKVDRSGLDVRARESYCTKPTDALSASPAAKALESLAAGGGAGNMSAKMQLPWFYDRPNVAAVDIAMDIDPSKVKFRKDKGKLHGELDLLGTASKPDGTTAARYSDAVMLDFDTQQQADAFLKTLYHYTGRFEIAPGDYTFRMIFSPGDKEFGKVEMPLSIAAWSGQALGMSGVALSRAARPATDGLAAGLDSSQLDGPRPLIAQGVEVSPTGTNQFRPGEKGLFYFEVYEPRLAAAPAVQPAAPLPNVSIRIRVLNRATGEQKNDSGLMSAGSHMLAGNPIIPVALGLPVADLSAGAYRLEVSVTDDKTQTAVVRSADFDVR